MHIYKKRGLAFHKIDKLSTISLITNIGIALATTIWAIYLESIFKNISYVGFFTGFLTFIGIICSIIFVPLIEQNNKTRLFSISLLLYSLSYILFSVNYSIFGLVLLGILLTAASTIRISSFGIIVRDNSKDGSVSKNLGLVYTFFNLAWLIGPLIGGFIASRYELKNVFITSASVIFFALILFKLFHVPDNRISKKQDKNFLKIVKDFFKNKERVCIYFLSGGITFWNTLIYTYMPIFIINSFESDLLVGYFLSATIIPLVLFEYFFGRIAGKVGFKKIFFAGYLILAIFSSICFFSSNLYLTLGLLVIGGIGIAMLESTTEAYFFDIVAKDERDKFYGPYNTTIDVNSFIASVFLAGLLLFLPFKFVFISVGAVMFILALVSLKIKNIIEKRK